MTVEFRPLAHLLRKVRAELDHAFDRVVNDGQFILGHEVEAFEQEFAQYCGANYCVTVGNGLDALAIALRAQGVRAGDEVIVPGHTFIATWLAVSQIGAMPIAVDVDPNTFNLAPALIESVLSHRTVAIMPVHLYGNPAPMDEINAIASRYGLFVIEDAAQAHGARYRSLRTGSLSAVASFSFYPTKNLGALGDGGAIVTCDARIADYARKFRNYGSLAKDVHEIAGANSRLDELQAAFLRTRLGHLDAENASRREIAAGYQERLSGLTGLDLPQVEPHCQHVYHHFVVRTRYRDRLANGLRARGIFTAIHYPRPPHLQAAFAGTLPLRASLPITERLAGEVLSLPIWPGMSARDIDAVARGIRDVLAEDEIRQKAF